MTENKVDRYPMTREGYDKIKQEIDFIKAVERPKNVKDIEAAVAQGDLSENSEYHAAKDKNAQLNGRLQMLEERMGKAEIIDPKTLKGQKKIMFGATVTLLDIDTDQKTTYQIVGEFESDIASSKISITSPIARGLVGKVEGAEVTIKTPKGNREFEVVKVEYK